MTVPSIGAFGGADTISPGTSPRTLSFDIGTPSNSKLFVGLYTADTDDTVTGITWNGSAMTQRAESGSSTTYDCEIWELDAPSGGTNNLEISYTGDGTYGGQVWWVRVDDAGATGTPFTANGTGTSVSSGSQTCPTNGLILVFAVHNFSTTAPSIAAGTSIGITQPTNRRQVAGYRTSTGAVSWTFASSQGWNLVGVTIDEVGGGSPELDLDPAALALAGSIGVTGDIEIGTSFDVSATAVALSGSLAVSGDIQITEAPELDLDPATLAIAGALSVSGDIEIGTSHDLAADPVALSGALAVSGDIEASVDPVLDIEASAIALSGSLDVSGDIDIGTSFDVEASAVALSGSFAVLGDVESSTFLLGETESVLYFPVRFFASSSSGSVDSTQDLENLRSLLPSQRQQVTNADGTMAAPWYRFFDFFVNVFAGGPSAPTMADVQAAIERALADLQAQQQTVALVAAQSQTNAEALAATVEVVQNNSLSGSSSIPAVSRTYLEP